MVKGIIVEKESLKTAIQEQQKIVQIELTGVAQGYQQAMTWVLGLLNQDNATPAEPKN